MKNTLTGSVIVPKPSNHEEMLFKYTWNSVSGIPPENEKMLHDCAKGYITAVNRLWESSITVLPTYNPPFDYVGTFEKITVDKPTAM
jgi:hypothetical protein